MKDIYTQGIFKNTMANMKWDGHKCIIYILKANKF